MGLLGLHAKFKVSLSYVRPFAKKYVRKSILSLTYTQLHESLSKKKSKQVHNIFNIDGYKVKNVMGHK